MTPTALAPWLARAWPALAPLRARGVHALLLHGAAGIGKKQLALEIAASLLCESRGDPVIMRCGRCAGCVLWAGGGHPDARVVVPDALAALRPGGGTGEAEASGEGEAATGAEATGEGRDKRASREIRIDQIRGLSDFLNLATHRGGMRVIMLAPAEALNAPAANALLKMLEEPGPATVFVLAADAIDRVLPTIRSRCVLVRVPAPTGPEAVQWLAQQGVAQPDEALAAAGGAPVRALVQAQSEGPVAGMLDPDTRTLLLHLLEKGPRLDSAEVAARVPRNVDVGGAITLFQRWAWDLLALRAAGAVRYHRPQQGVLTRLAEKADSDALWAWSDALRDWRASAEHPLNARLVVEAALLHYGQALREARTGH
jgi:DNA polymerase-3 subunit delta'